METRLELFLILLLNFQSPAQPEGILARLKAARKLPELYRATAGELKSFKKTLSIGGAKRLVKWVCPDKQLFEPDQAEPRDFLSYIYNIALQPSCPEILEEIAKWPAMRSFTSFQEARIEGYTAFSAAILAPDLSRQKKKELINNLKIIGLQPSNKDREAARYELWQITPELSKKKLYLLHPESPSRQLPKDLLHHIGSFCTELEPENLLASFPTAERPD